MDCSSFHGVQELRRGQHVCLLYARQDDPLATVAPFIAAGLEAGERCLYVVGEHEPARIERALAAVGIDVARQVERGALLLVSRWEVSFSNGEFDPVAMIGFVRQAISQAVADGFTCLRVVAEMTWALQLGVGANKLIHYEALGNHLYPDEPLVALCMYDRSRFPEAVCRDAMRVHPWVAVGQTVYDNLYFEPPEVMRSGPAADAHVDWMLEQLKRMHEASLQRLELRTALAAKAQAEAAARDKDTMLSMLAHELRTPLTSMLAFSQSALRRLDRDQVDLGSLRHSLEVVARQAIKQARLIDQVLEAARLSSNRLSLALARCELTALVREVAELMQAMAPQHTVVVRCPGPVEAVVDAPRVEQVLLNLLDNARKYSPPGTSIEVGVSEEPDAVLVTVRDHGAGIPAEERERIFERFHRLSSDQSGVGLGLHISREFVRMHGGELSVESPPDGGARFVARLPRSAAVAGAENRPEHPR